MSIVRDNLMNRKGYTPYCGNEHCRFHMPRTRYIGGQFQCACGWRSSFDDEFIEAYEATWADPSPKTREVGEGRDRMQLTSGYYNSFDVVIGALETGGAQAQAAGHIAHGACLLHAAAELRHVWDERKSEPCDPVVDEGRG